MALEQEVLLLEQKAKDLESEYNTLKIINREKKRALEKTLPTTLSKADNPLAKWAGIAAGILLVVIVIKNL